MNYLNKIKEFNIENKDFKDENGEIISYATVKLLVSIKGTDKVLNLSGKNGVKPLDLQLFLDVADNATDDTEKSFLDD